MIKKINLYIKGNKYNSVLLNSVVGRRMLNGSFWSLVGSFTSQGLVLVSSIIIARVLGKKEFGEFGIIRSTVNVFTNVAGFGLGITATKYVAEAYKTHKKKTGEIIGITNVFALIFGL